MKKSTFILSIGFLLIFSSCSDKKDPEYDFPNPHPVEEDTQNQPFFHWIMMDVAQLLVNHSIAPQLNGSVAGKPKAVTVMRGKLF